MNKLHLLIVEDEANIADVLIAYARAEGYNVTHLERGDGVVAFLQHHQVDLVLLDLMLPGEDGLSICRQVRQFSDIPMIMITAKKDEIDRLLGLELGADDYICKPFSPREVMARVKAVLRRFAPRQQDELKAGDFIVSAAQFTASYRAQPLELTPSEFKLLTLLLSHPQQVFSRAQLIEHLYPDNDDIVDRNIDTHVKNIRKKLSTIAPDQTPITSVYGVGYKFAG
ncbi:two-component system, OmpR family, catabolic regulation response regulator CreB [Pseudoalteromonas rubra]|uniref:Two-component system, OmpR family, catabolic regulation response regulator CreB n=1 Tax=Pseudoalteromonas rubra TaxID=43658 RepID=A0A8T0C0Z0_9GAMM|nr:response regulator [Pseudoalteromonas rubra]KAF7781294.1 two-component system, OmpR family, catabolic regulation response regulator CreB [Pseudoalteromonas rubra]